MLDTLEFRDPDTSDPGGTIPLPQTIHNQLCQQIIIDRIVDADIISKIEQHYRGFTFKGSTKFDFTQLEQGCGGIPAHGENCQFLGGKWAQIKPYDLTATISLNESNTKAPFDDQYEVYGGKHEFINHSFGFMPERGTMIIHPSSPHFINAHAPIKRGALTIVKFHLVSNVPMIYQPSDYPGNYTNWFRDV